MIFLEKKKKTKKKTHYNSAAEGVQVFGKRSWSKAYLSVVVVVVIEVNEREFFQRSSVYSWKCKCERKGRTQREHIFGDFFKIFSSFFLLLFFFSSSHRRRRLAIKNGSHTHHTTTTNVNDER